MRKPGTMESEGSENNSNYNVSLTVEQFQKVCRTCLIQGDLKPIFGIIYNEKSLPEILTACSTFQIKNEDYLPQNICSTCLLEIFQMYAFLQKCRDSDAILQYIFNRDLQANITSLNGKTIEMKDELVDSSTLLDPTTNDSDTDSREVDVKKKRTLRKLHTRKKCRLRALEPPYTCKDCNESYEELKLLKEHRKQVKHTEIRTHACPVCSKMFTNSKLRQHMRAHTKEKPYKCKICFQAFSMSGNLKRHMMTHTGERPHVCEFCGKGFIQATTLHNHKKTHSKFEKLVGAADAPRFHCNICGRGFKRLARYNAHLKKHDSKTGEIIKTSLGENEKSWEYICTICSRPCKTKHLLKAHERTHGEKSFLCSACGKSFVTKAALHSHLKVHTGEKPYTCNICRKAFAHVGSFEAHVLIHTGQKPYRCTVCTKAFTQLSHLKYHKRTHNGERPYVCSYCGKTFALKGNLTVHIRTHTGETPYVCSICNKGFYDSSSMKKHKRGHVDVNLTSAAPHFPPQSLPPLLPPVLSPPLPPPLRPPVHSESNLNGNHHMGFIPLFHYQN